MALLKEWQKVAYNEKTPQNELQKFWQRYFLLEKGVYEKLLTNPDEVVEGTVKELADKYGLSVMEMTGFLDGINDSLHFWQQFILMISRHPKLLSCICYAGKSHFRHGADLGFHFCCTVGAIQSFQNINSLFHILIRHFAGAFCQGFSTDITVFHVGIADLTIAVCRMSFHRMMFYDKMRM